MSLPFRFGNEVYTWFMSESGKTWENKLDHMIEVTAEAGMQGIEPIYSWMGDFKNPELLQKHLEKNKIELAAIALVLDWNHAEETQEERKVADEAIEFLVNHFPDTILCTVQMPTNRDNLEERRKHLVSNVNAVSKRAADRGLTCSFHPNSPETSINRTAEDYKVILENLDASVTGWTPDIGHIVNGGMDSISQLEKYKELINHVHYKDWDGNPEFALMGQGSIDFTEVTQWLLDHQYSGWIICEDEAPSAVEAPDEVTLHDGKWIKEKLIPSLRF